MRVKAIVFDLDDTLYDELTFVLSGFQAVADFMLKDLHIPSAESLRFMQKELQQNGRGRIFDETLREYGAYTAKNRRKCLSIYRLHKPNIRLYPEADDCLTRFKTLPVYIVTDGNKIVQSNKVTALGLNSRIKRAFITNRFGRDKAKPSSYCFRKIAKIEKAETEEVVYIADNPRKDFVGIKPLGFKTVRLLKSQHSSIKLSPEYEAETTIDSLNELTADFLANL